MSSGFHPTVPLVKANLLERWSGMRPDVRTGHSGEFVASGTYTGLASVHAARQTGGDANDIGVSWGNPHPEELADVAVIIDDTSSYEWKPAAALTQVNETYSLRVYITILKDVGTDRQAMWQRAYDLFAEIWSDLYRMDRESDMPPVLTVGGSTSRVAFLLPQVAHDVDAPNNDKREQAITFDIAVTARLSDG